MLTQFHHCAVLLFLNNKKCLVLKYIFLLGRNLTADWLGVFPGNGEYEMDYNFEISFMDSSGLGKCSKTSNEITTSK